MSDLNCNINRNAGGRTALASMLLVGALLIGAAGAKAQQAQPNASTITAMAQAVPAVTQATAAAVQQAPAQTAAAESEGPQTLHLLVGRSLVISSPTKIKRVSLADPTIAEAIVVSPFQVLVNGKTPGGVSLLRSEERRVGKECW